MRTEKEQVERIESALLASTRHRPPAGPGPGWQAGVMHEIRALHGETAGESWTDRFGVITWRIAPALAALALVFFAGSVLTGESIELQVAQVFFYDPAGALSMQVLGL